MVMGLDETIHTSGFRLLTDKGLFAGQSLSFLEFVRQGATITGAFGHALIELRTLWAGEFHLLNLSSNEKPPGLTCLQVNVCTLCD